MTIGSCSGMTIILGLCCAAERLRQAGRTGCATTHGTRAAVRIWRTTAPHRRTGRQTGPSHFPSRALDTARYGACATHRETPPRGRQLLLPAHPRRREISTAAADCACSTPSSSRACRRPVRRASPSAQSPATEHGKGMELRRRNELDGTSSAGPRRTALHVRHRPRAEIRRRRCSSRCGRGRGRLASSRDPPVLLPLRPRSRPPRLEPNRAQGSRPRAVIWIRPPPPLVGRERVADDCCRDGRKWRSGEGVSGSPAAPRGVGWPEEAWERKWESGGG
jgi:hypothetical protein